MKLLFVTDKISEGGAERACSIFANECAGLGHDVTLLANRFTDNEYPVSKKVKLIRLPENKLFLNENFISRNIKRLPTYVKIVKEINPDFIIPFMSTNTIIMSIVNLFCHKKVIGTVRVNFAVPDDFVPNWIRDFFYKRCKGIWCQNIEQVKYFSRKIQTRCFVIPNCTRDDLIQEGEKRNYDNKKSAPINITAIGRLSKQKNHKMLIEAFSKLDNNNLKLNIYGEGELRNDLQKLIDSYGLTDRVFLKGWTNDIACVMRETDIFVLSSDYEGQPNVLQEAMTCGIPCISTACPTGASELIKNNETGLLVPVNDTQALQEAIDCLSNDSELIVKLGKNGYNFVKENFASSVLTRQLIFYLEDITMREI